MKSKNILLCIAEVRISKDEISFFQKNEIDIKIESHSVRASLKGSFYVPVWRTMYNTYDLWRTTCKKTLRDFSCPTYDLDILIIDVMGLDPGRTSDTGKVRRSFFSGRTSYVSYVVRPTKRKNFFLDPPIPSVVNMTLTSILHCQFPYFQFRSVQHYATLLFDWFWYFKFLLLYFVCITGNFEILKFWYILRNP